MTAPITLAVEYDGCDDLVGDYTDQLSSGSMFVATELELAPSTRVQLVLSFPGLIAPLEIDGEVCGTRDSPGDVRGATIEFAAAARTRLASTIERIRERDPAVVSRALRLLFVEDNRHVSTLIQDGLRAAARREFAGTIAFVFHTVEDGRSALEILSNETFDALICDVYLPYLDGPRVIAHVRSELGLADLPIIAVSAGGEAARKAALDAGANVFIDKPMRLREVIAAIQRLLPATLQSRHAVTSVVAT